MAIFSIAIAPTNSLVSSVKQRERNVEVRAVSMELLACKLW
jgi:hypothetical protein